MFQRTEARHSAPSGPVAVSLRVLLTLEHVLNELRGESDFIFRQEYQTLLLSLANELMVALFAAQQALALWRTEASL